MRRITYDIHIIIHHPLEHDTTHNIHTTSTSQGYSIRESKYMYDVVM
jgi:hypothetical protein